MSRRNPLWVFPRIFAHIIHPARLIHDIVRSCIRIYRSTRNTKGIIGIVLLEHFGDIVACEPLIRRLKTDQPNSCILWFVKRPYDEYIALNPHVDFVVPIQCLTTGIALGSIPVFDRYYVLHHNKRMCPICRIQLRKRYGAPEVTVDNYYSYGSLLRSYAMSNGIVVNDERPRLYFPDDIAAACRAMSPRSRYIVLHCASNESSRDWRAGNWAQLADMLCRNGANVVEVGTVSALSGFKNNPRYSNLCGRTSLVQMAYIVSQAAFFFGIDSGPAQIAHAANIPKIILLGNYRGYGRYMPYSGPIDTAKEIMYEENINDIDPSRVYELFQTRMDHEGEYSACVTRVSDSTSVE